MLKNKKITLIITGGIAAYKTPDLVRKLKKLGAEVFPILTKSGAELVSELALATVSKNRVHQNTFSTQDVNDINHIHLAQDVDLILVAPATANILAKMRTGIADDLASTTLLAASCPVMIAPAMNTQMWENPATIENFEILKKRGILSIDPTSGELACGTTGVGRMAEIETIVKAVTSQFSQINPQLHDVSKHPKKRIIITSGATKEHLDPIRFISNHSSGKQGAAVADACIAAGFETIFITGTGGSVQAIPSGGAEIITVETAEEMRQACLEALPADAFIGVAAVADWKATDPSKHKIKKKEGENILSVTFEKNPDILKTIGELPDKKRPSLVVGFAAETENTIENAKTKKAAKSCNWILANTISNKQNPFGSNKNTIFFIDEKNNPEEWKNLEKTTIGQHLVQKITEFFNEDNN